MEVWELNLYECRILCVALCKTSISFFRMISYVDRTYQVGYQLPGTGIYTAAAVRIAAAEVYSSTPIVLLYDKGDAIRIEPRPSSPSTCRLCARSSRTFFRPQESGDGTLMQTVLGESIASCRLSINSSEASF